MLKVAILQRQSARSLTDLEQCALMAQTALRSTLVTGLFLAIMGPVIVFYGVAFIVLSKSVAVSIFGVLLTVIGAIALFCCRGLYRNRGIMIRDRNRLIEMYQQQYNRSNH